MGFVETFLRISSRLRKSIALEYSVLYGSYVPKPKAMNY